MAPARAALELQRRAPGEDHPDVLPRTHPGVLLSMNNLASVLREQGRMEEAEVLFRDALALRVQVYGDDHPSGGPSRCNLGRLLHARGRPDEAAVHLRAALDIDRCAHADSAGLARTAAVRAACEDR